MKRYKTGIVIALAALGALTLTTQVFSQNCRNYAAWTSNSNAQWWNYQTPQEYALSSDQISKMNDIRATSSKKNQPIYEELRALRVEYNTHISSLEPDIKKMETLRGKIRDKEEKVEDINLSTRSKVKNILNKEQLQYFKDSNYYWWNMSENCWHTGSRMMQHRNKRMMDCGHRCC